MQYRKFGDLDWEVSALGFGAMRLPTTAEGDIDQEEAIEMIRYGIDQGINYIDTAWPYHGGESEIVVGKALADGYRKQVKLATKLPSWEIESEADLDKYLNQQFEKLGVDKIDFYLLHALDEDHWANYKEVGLENVFAWIERIKEEGKIDNIGFSFHDDYNLFKEIINSYDWDFCQIQYNYIDTEYQAGKKGLKLAAEKDIPVVIMEPLKGGSLAGEVYEPLQEVFAQATVERTSTDWALQWLWNQPEVSVVLSGMSNLQQLKENIGSAANSGIDRLSEEELNVVNKAANKYKELAPVDCTGCGYCLPCSQGVRIPKNFSIYNQAQAFGIKQEKQKKYDSMTENDQQASACVACGECEEICPQDLAIIDLLAETADYFEE
ncbi:aldo/keto reductase [Halanaerobaculum tunisiense]